ncbi:PREDICTED: E3 [Prunus dulcis]|uniref:RING-type E3 ubiquitin transferase n=1 Tax=Prunus dulcis TaxID=3755 RepID=A0A5E4EY80_PRUDU|nr:NEP1-interacting protein 1-like [Prunus dulcis]VVA20442.1 PREDICTED: E3 [Prunus dulcis]
MEDFLANAIHHKRIRFSFSFNDITAELNNPNRVHNRNRSSVQPVKFHVKIVHDTHYKYVNRSLNRTETTIREYVERKERKCRFDMDKLKNFREAHGILSIMLALVGISRDNASNKYMVDKIIVQGLILGNKLSSMGRKVLGLCVYMRTEQVKSRCESCTQLQEIVMSSSNNEGMVPASDSAVKTVLKRVRVGADDKEASCCEEEGRERKRRKVCVSESDSCTVCMEEFNGGSEVACMPCSHVFHDKCIRTWLRQSHYCPVCRFEVPTAD